MGQVADACARRLASGSPSPRADRNVVSLHEACPGDQAVVTSLLLNAVTLQSGDATFVPAGGARAYLRGVGIEIMASSDNVLRADLVGRHIAVEELFANVDRAAAPPIRVTPETSCAGSRVFCALVDDFELSVTTTDDDHPLSGRGPRILACLDGEVALSAPQRTAVPSPG